MFLMSELSHFTLLITKLTEVDPKNLPSGRGNLEREKTIFGHVMKRWTGPKRLGANDLLNQCG